LAAIGSASVKALKTISRAYRLLPLLLEASFGTPALLMNEAQVSPNQT
jgi:hypothetical protein